MSTHETIDGYTLFDERSPAVDRQQLERIYQQRATQLAARVSEGVHLRQTQPFLVVAVRDERFGIDVSAVVEVLRYEKCVSIPGARFEVLGVVNRRGCISAVIDLARILGLTSSKDQYAGHIVVVRHAGIQVGLRVDEADRIERYDSEEIRNNGNEHGGLSSRFVQGRSASGLSLLSIEAIFSHPAYSLQTERHRFAQ